MGSSRKEILHRIWHNLKAINEDLKLLSPMTTDPLSFAEENKPPNGWFAKRLAGLFGKRSPVNDGYNPYKRTQEVVKNLIEACKVELALAIADEYKAERDAKNAKDQQ